MKNINIMVLLIIVTVSAMAYGGEEIYSIENVKNNVINYLKRVFDKNSPASLEEYYSFEGIHAGGEYELASELRECEKIYNDINDQQCDKLIQDRKQAPEKVPSLFYRDLSKLYPIEVESIKIKNINKINAASGRLPYYVAIATGKIKSKDVNIVVHHSYYKKSKTDLINDGYVSILEINESKMVDIHYKLENE